MKLKSNKTQSGAALFVALIMLLVLTVIGLSASQNSVVQERMAANVHISNMTFNAAESAINAFLVEANTGNKLDDGHVLSELRTTDTVVDKFFDKNGLRVASGYFDNDNDDGNGLRVSIEPKIDKDCDENCGGFSFGSDIGCRHYSIVGTGELVSNGNVIQTEKATLWAKEITVCN